MLKKFIIRWAIEQIKTLDMNKINSSSDLGEYGISDIVEEKETGKTMYIF